MLHVLLYYMFFARTSLGFSFPFLYILLLFMYSHGLTALEGFNNVPLLHPLETLHNNLTFHQVDDFLGRVTSTRFVSSIPQQHPSICFCPGVALSVASSLSLLFIFQVYFGLTLLGLLWLSGVQWSVALVSSNCSWYLHLLLFIPSVIGLVAVMSYKSVLKIWS